MKKKLLIVVLLILLVAGFSFAKDAKWAVGGEFGLSALGGLPNSALLSVRFPNLPIMFGIGAQLGENTFNMALLMDWWLWHQHLVGIIDIYAGPGLFVGLPEPFVIGGRIPIGLQIWPLGTSLLELFLEIAPGITFLGSLGVQIPNFVLQAGFGFRFWF